VRAQLAISPGGRIQCTDSEGRFAFEGLEDSDHSLSISEPRAQVPGIRRDGLRPGPQEIEIVVRDDERASGSIAGRVLDADLRAVGGAQVMGECLEAPGQAQRARSDVSGAFELERLPAGTYRVRIDAEGCPRIWAGEIRVERDQRVELGTLTIPQPGFLVGGVTLRDGGPKEVVYYGVIDADGHSALAVWLSSEPARRDPLVPGKYRLIVRAPDAAEVSREFEIEAGRETHLDVEVGSP
jgi:hypothetical protein